MSCGTAKHVSVDCTIYIYIYIYIYLFYIYIYIYIYYGIFELYGAFISMDIYHKPTDTHRYLTVILNLVIPHIYRHPILPSSSIKVDL